MEALWDITMSSYDFLTWVTMYEEERIMVIY